MAIDSICSRIYTRHDIGATLASGQTFAFSDTRGGYSGIAGGRPVEIVLHGGIYEIRCPMGDADFWLRYFDIGRSYDALLSKFICGDGTYDASAGENRGKVFLTQCAAAFGGLRLLRQPVWETICEFIISANNHQKRIESIYKRISSHFGDTVVWEGRVYSAFPTAQKLADAGEIGMRSMGLGYRAPYLLDTARKISHNGLPDLDSMSYGEALKWLMKLRGVGEKVADCILLFSTNHQEAFPVDVWIERALTEHYGMSGSRRSLKHAAQEKFGEAAGIVQQFLFHGMRSRLM